MRRGHSGAAVTGRMVLIGAITAAVAACGSAAGSNGAAAHIRRNWATFFAYGSSTSQRVSLLQDGERYRGVLEELARSALAQQAHARVTNVAVHGQAADVTFTFLRGGSPVIPDRTGRAVLVDGVWKVSDGTFCSLVALAFPTPPACPSPPSAGS